jgi:hypothetical protein
VHLSVQRRYAFGDFQLNYLDYRRRRLIPSTRIYQEGELLYRTNSLGCVGDEIEPGPVVAFFGDSCTHGYAGGAFVDHVAFPGCQVLNAGIEGLTLPWIGDRFLELRPKVPMICAAVHSGWHNILYNQRDEGFWTEQFDRIQGVPVIAHFRLIGDVNEDAVRLGYDDVLARVAGYQAWKGFDHTVEADRRQFLDEIARFNRFIERYCLDRGRILIDLEPVMRPRAHADLGAAFLDFVHPSPAIYPQMANAVMERLAEPVRAALGVNLAAES